MADEWILVERITGAERPELGRFTSAAEAGKAAEQERKETGVALDIKPG